MNFEAVVVDGPFAGGMFKTELPEGVKFSVGMRINVNGQTYAVADGPIAQAMEKTQETVPNTAIRFLFAAEFN